MASQDITTSLYNGKYDVVFRNSSHTYKVNGTTKKGVTTAMSKVLAKPGLMTWAMEMALSYLKRKLPVITLADLDEARKAHTVRRDAGADIGSIVHDVAEKLLAGEAVEWDELPDEAVLAADGFDEWLKVSKAKAISTEQVVYSETLDYTGTYDSVLKLGGRVYLCDLKTTNAGRDAPEGIYSENFIQLGAYAFAYEEQRVYEEAHGGSTLVPLDDLMIISAKKNGIVHTKAASELGLTITDCIELWQAVWFLAERLERIKKQLSGRSK